MKSLGIVFATVAVVAGATIAFLTVKASNEWQAFKVEHNCVVIEHIPQKTTVGYSYGYHFINGKYQYGYGFGTVTTPESNVYHCDDNQDYTR